MKNPEKPKKPATEVNVSIHRAVLDETGDFLSAVIVELINYRFIKNDKKPVYLKIDWIHEKLPYISRAGLAKKIEKLIKDGHIIQTKGEGRHYHKCWYSLGSLPRLVKYPLICLPRAILTTILPVMSQLNAIHTNSRTALTADRVLISSIPRYATLSTPLSELDGRP